MARNNYRGGTTPRRAPKDLGRRVKKKPCAMCRDGVEWVDYKDVPVLRKYMSDRGKIRSRRVTGNCAQHQRDIAQAIKVARELVLLPYTQRTVTEKPGGRGGRGDRGDRGDRPMAPGGFRGDRTPSASIGGGDRGTQAVKGVPGGVGQPTEGGAEVVEVVGVEVGSPADEGSSGALLIAGDGEVT